MPYSRLLEEHHVQAEKQKESIKERKEDQLKHLVCSPKKNWIW